MLKPSLGEQGMARAGLHSCLPCNECQALRSGERGYWRWWEPAVSKQGRDCNPKRWPHRFVPAYEVDELREQLTILP